MFKYIVQLKQFCYHLADNVFAYLGDDILNSTLQDFSRLINTHFPGQVQNDPVLKSWLKKFSHRSDRWPEEVVKSLQNCESPCYTKEQVVKINQSFINDTDLINKLRKAKISQFSDEIKRQKDLKQTDLSFIDLSREALRQGWDAYTEQVEKSVWPQKKKKTTYKFSQPKGNMYRETFFFDTPAVHDYPFAQIENWTILVIEQWELHSLIRK